MTKCMSCGKEIPTGEKRFLQKASGERLLICCVQCGMDMAEERIWILGEENDERLYNRGGMKTDEEQNLLTAINKAREGYVRKEGLRELLRKIAASEVSCFGFKRYVEEEVSKLLETEI